VPGTWTRPGCSPEGDPCQVNSVFAPPRWPAAARLLLNAIDSWRKWALFGVSEDVEWIEGNVALLGDAAHAMLPFAAQGAGMAIEDAVVLAKTLSEARPDGPTAIAGALKRYAKLRRSRVAQVQRTARQQGRIYHMTGPFALARDLSIKAMGPQRLAARQSWIYDWRL